MGQFLRAEHAFGNFHRFSRGSDGPALADALSGLYAHVYGVSEQSARPAAQQGALAMRYSDQWVRG